MATTTISIDSEAYALLDSIRTERESFSQVIKRCLSAPAGTCGELADALKAMEGVSLITPERRAVLRAGRKRRSPRRHAA
jgi:predicted CopG family antitoxin